MKLYFLDFYNSCCGYNSYFVTTNKELAIKKQRELSNALDQAEIREVEVETLNKEVIELDNLF